MRGKHGATGATPYVIPRALVRGICCLTTVLDGVTELTDGG
ncbi:hypothetical protein [Thermodesulfovibrio sp.]|nr:hypothetical protein [Thermodesulfovibrio sp.]